MSDPFIGTVVADKYELLSVLGVGGMSTIYKARHKYMGRLAAVKLLHPYLVADASMFQRFQYEAKAASNLSHPNVVGIYDFGITDDGKAYLVMDYLEGEDLSSILDRDTLLPEIQALEVFRQAAAGLDHAHSKGVIHRDLKPSNLFLCPQDDDTFIVKLVDFGIAKISETSGESAQNLTRTGEVFGSPLYMSPEQCSGKPLDNRSDIYSLGCVMYEVLTGRRPLVGDTAIDTMHKHLKEKPLAFSKVAPTISVSPKVEAVVFKCLEKSPKDRFESVSDLYHALFGEALPKHVASAVRSGGPSVNLEVRSGSSGGSSVVKVAGDPGEATAATIKALPFPLAGKKWQLSASIMALLTAISFAALGTWVVCFWDGPPTDSGKLIDHWQYLYYMGKGNELIALKNYAEAENDLKQAEVFAKKCGDNYGRLMNVYRSELTLYGKSNQFDKQADTITNMTDITRKRAHKDFDTALGELKSVNQLINDKKHGLSHMGEREQELRLSALMNGIRDCAKRLGAVADYEHQEKLLSDTIDTYTQLASDDDPQLAALDMDLAECHVSQDEFFEAKPLFKKSLDIYVKARADHKGQVSELDLAQIWLRVGQFDRDRSNFKDGGPELATAYSMLKKYGSEKTAALDGGKGIRLLIECLNGLADYSNQTGDQVAQKKYQEEAQAMKKMRRQLGIGIND